MTTTDFITLLSYLAKNQTYNHWLKGLFFPVRFDPRSNTMLVAISQKSHSKQFMNEQLDFEFHNQNYSYELCFIVLSAHNIADMFWAIKDGPENQKFEMTYLNYQTAVKQFEFVCGSENNYNHPNTLSCILQRLSHRITFSFFDEQKGGIAEILNNQKLFYGYHSAGLPPNLKRDKRLRFNVEDQIKDALGKI